MRGKDYRCFSYQIYWTNFTPSECIERRHYIFYGGINYTLDVKQRQKITIELSFIFVKMLQPHLHRVKRLWRKNFDNILMEKISACLLNSDL